MEQTTTTAVNPHHTAHPEEHPSHKATYVTIFFVLGFLTVLEIYVPEVYSSEWSGTTKMLLLCLLAIIKAGLVGAFFMHLIWETRWLRWIAYMPIYMGFAVIIIMLETVYR